MNTNIKLFKNDLPDEIKISNSQIIAIDCEMTGLKLRDRLCTLQISTGNNDAMIVQFDVDNANSPNLSRILSDKKITKIFHFARMDLIFIRRYLNVKVENVLDTKIASKLARTFTSNHGLKDLIKEVTGIEISKQMQTSYFGGELSEKQIKYAASDVLYLHKIHNYLENILIKEKRINLYKDAIKFINTRVDLDMASFEEDIWSH